MVARIAASVGVAMPANIAPSRTTGVISDQNASRNVGQNGSLGGTVTFTLRCQKRYANMIMIMMPVITPGTTPPRNKSPIGTFAMLPKMTMLMLGGMIGPIVDDEMMTP